MNSEKGFVLIEFVIALPLIIMLLYGLSQSTLTIISAAKSQAANYVLEVEAQETLMRIIDDLRTASSISRKNRFSNQDIDTLTIKYHTNKYDAGKIIDLIDTRVYIVANNFHLQAKRREGSSLLNPITGGNFFGDTVITYLRYTKLDEKVVRVELEMQSSATNQYIKLSTAVFMPACEEMKNF